jgi:hypothetical protein
LVELNDGTVLDEVEIEYPVGHKRRRAEGTPLLINKFKRCIMSIPLIEPTNYDYDRLTATSPITTTRLTSRSMYLNWFYVPIIHFNFAGSWISSPRQIHCPDFLWTNLLTCLSKSNVIYRLRLEYNNYRSQWLGKYTSV